MDFLGARHECNEDRVRRDRSGRKQHRVVSHAKVP